MQHCRVACCGPFSGLVLVRVSTPNGTTENSRFKGYGTGITAAELIVFNRAGSEIFRAPDLNTVLNFGWDGTYKGKPVKQGVYAYRVSASFYNNISFEKLGTVTLIR